MVVKISVKMYWQRVKWVTRVARVKRLIDWLWQECKNYVKKYVKKVSMKVLKIECQECQECQKD